MASAGAVAVVCAVVARRGRGSEEGWIWDSGGKGTSFLLGGMP